MPANRISEPPAESNKTITMSDVARHAGVSHAAISSVLSGGQSSARVSEATRARILLAARDLHYTPNAVARALRRQRTDLFGLYLWDKRLDIRGPFLAEIVSGLQRGCNLYRKDLLIHGTFREQSIDDIYGSLINGKIDGLVLFAEAGDPLATRLMTASLPVITVADLVPPLPGVVADDQAGSRLLARHLAARGHTRILYRKGSAIQSSTCRRYAAFCETAAALGMTVLEDATHHFGEGDELSETELRCLALPTGQRPTAIVCWNDHLADRTIVCCEALGVRVPENIAVVGFDGLPSKARPARRLTTVRAPWADVAQTAIDLLLQRLAGEAIPPETTLPVELIEGDTT